MRSKLFWVHPRWLLRATIILFIALFSLMVTSTEGSLLNVVPQTSHSPFDFIDGDLEGNPDWGSLPAGEVNAAADLDSGQQDDALGKGAKEDEPEPAIVTGSIPKNKSDLLRFYVADERIEHVVGEQVVADHFLYLAWVRDNTLGTANMDFELNQNICDPAKPEDSICSSNSITPERLLNDILVTFDMGSEIQLGLSRWIETGQCESAASAPCWSPIIDLAGSGYAVGAVNEVSVLDPIAGTTGEPLTLEPLTFGEAAINLTLAEVFDPNICTNLGSAYLKSRSSNSFTASLKDFIAPQSVSVSNCGNIVINKVTDPSGDPTSFKFTPSYGDTFDLVDGGSDKQQLVRGSYTITEAFTEGWYLKDLICVDPSGDTTTSIENREAVIELDASEDVTCTFYNTKMGNIIIQAETLPENILLPLSFSLAGGPAPVGLEFNLNSGDIESIYDVSLNSGGLLSGSGYVVTDTSTLPSDWYSTGYICVDRDRNGVVIVIDDIYVSPSGEVVCTFYYTQRGHIIVDKIAIGGDATFTFSTTGSGYSGFDLIGGGLNDQELAPGSYSVTEIGLSGWELTELTCDGTLIEGATADIELAPGDTVTCTFTNTKQLFTIITLVCHENKLYASSVVLDEVGSGDSLVSGNLPDGLDEAVLCGLGGASFASLDSGTYNGSVYISPIP